MTLFPFRIVIIGDYNPVVDKFDFASWIPCNRVNEISGQYLPHLDMVNKFKFAYDLYHEAYNSFIWVCDDYYPVHEFDYNYIKKYYYLQPNFIGDIKRPSNTWQHDLAKTGRLLRNNGFKCVNFTTHFPIVFEFEKLINMFDKFDMYHNSYVIENLYCNYYDVQKDIQADSIRLGVWRQEDSFQKLDDILNNKYDVRKFIACSVVGYNSIFEKKLCKYLGI